MVLRLINVFIFLFLSLICCNKNSNELPVLKTSQLTIGSDTLNEPLVDFIFSQNYNAGSEQVFVTLRNNSSRVLTELTYLTEACRQSTILFNCYSRTVKLDSLKPGRLSNKQLLWTNKNIELNKNLIHAIILDYKENQQSLSPINGYYSSGIATLEKDSISENKIFLEAQGSIKHDGGTEILLKKGDKNYYSISGKFYTKEAYRKGILRKIDQIISEVTLDSLDREKKQLLQADDEMLQLRFEINKPIDDSLKYFSLKLFK